MKQPFSFAQFKKKFPTNIECLDAIKQLRFPKDSACAKCMRLTTYYKVDNRTAYTCKFCRHQVFPLAGTIFEKSTTPLTVWFYAMFLMTATRGTIPIKELQKELHVTYKTAWRIYTSLFKCMQQNNGDLLFGKQDLVRKWVFFNKLEIKISQKD